MDETKPRAKSGWTKTVRWLLGLCVLCMAVANLFPCMCRPKENARRSSCQSNLKQIMLGMKQYLQDYDARFPLASTTKPKIGWASAVQHYTQISPIFQCPSEETAAQSDPAQLEYTDYWFNARASAAYAVQIDDPLFTITLGDGNDDSDATNASYHLLSIPARWRKDEKSPLYRHLDGANYAFADGHIKWFRPTRWKSELDMTNGPTLRLKATN